MANRVGWSFFANDKFSRVAERIKNKIKLMKKNFKQLNTVMTKTASKLKKVASAAKSMSLVATAAIIGSAKAFGDMEQGVTNVLTLLDDKQVAKFGGQIDSLAKESLSKFGFSIEESTQALFNNVSALGANEKSFAAFETAQRLAVGGVTTLDTAVSGIAAVMNAYGKETTGANEVANAFFAAQKKGTTDVAKLATNVGQVAPIAKSAGIGFKELLATMAELTQGGLSTEESTTALKGVISSLLKPTSDAEKILKRLGVPFGATQLRANGLANTLEKLTVISEKYPDELAKAIPNIRGFTAAAALGKKQIDNIRETVKSMDQDQLSPAVAKQMETFNRATAMAFGSIKLLAIEIGAKLAPFILKIGKGIQSLIKRFRGFSDTTKTLIAIIITIVAVFAPLIAGVAGLITILGPGLAVIGGILAALIGWPFAIAAIVAAIGTFIALNWDKVIKAWNAIKGFFGFGDDKNVNVTGSAELLRKSEARIAVELTAKAGTSATVRTQTSGPDAGDIGVNMRDEE